MRILSLDLGAERRGGQRQTLHLARALAARGHDVVVAVRSGSPLAADVVAAGLPRIDVRPGSEASPGTLLDVARAVRRVRPDVLHAGDARAHGACVFSRAVRHAPLVVHRRVAFAPRSHPLSRAKYAAASAYVAVAGAVARTLAEARIPPARIVVVPDGLPADAFRDGPSPGEPPFRLLHVGAFDGMKGQEIALAVLDGLVAGGFEAEMAFLGDGPARARVEARATELGLRSRCRFEGVVVDVPDRLARSHLLLLPSSAEAVAYVLYEAMAAGCPVLAHDVGGVSETLDSGRAGALVPTLDPVAWVGAAAGLLSDGAARRALVAEGRRRANELRIEETARRVEAVFLEAVAERRR